MLSVNKGDPEWTQTHGKDQKYRMKFNGRYLYCSCLGWKYKKSPRETRVCRHIAEMFPDYVPQNPPPRRSVPKFPKFTSQTNVHNVPNITDYMWSEKYDGVRVHWDGHTLATRTGRIINAPESFLVGLPAIQLDGELWAGYKSRQRVISAMESGDTSGEWNNIKLMAFDIPDDRYFYDMRYESLMASIGIEYASCELVEHFPVESAHQMESVLGTVVAKGGEGIVLRHPSGKYDGKQSSNNGIKVKQVSVGSGRITSKDGETYIVKINLPSKCRGKLIKIRESSYIRTLKKGRNVAFEYRGFTNQSKPQFARFT